MKSFTKIQDKTGFYLNNTHWQNSLIHVVGLSMYACPYVYLHAKSYTTPSLNDSQTFHIAVSVQNFSLTNRHPYYWHLIQKNTSEVVKTSDKLQTTHHGLEDCWWFIDDKLDFLNLSYNYPHKY